MEQGSVCSAPGAWPCRPGPLAGAGGPCIIARVARESNVGAASMYCTCRCDMHAKLLHVMYMSSLMVYELTGTRHYNS